MRSPHRRARASASVSGGVRAAGRHTSGRAEGDGRAPIPIDVSWARVPAPSSAPPTRAQPLPQIEKEMVLRPEALFATSTRREHPDAHEGETTRSAINTSAEIGL